MPDIPFRFIPAVLLFFLFSDVGAGLKCFNCNDVTDPNSCSAQVTCQSDEVCFAERMMDSAHQSKYFYSCQKRQVCQALDSGSGVLGRREAGGDGVETLILNCMQCCYTDMCNRHLCQQYHSTVPSKFSVVVQPSSAVALQGRNQDVEFSCSFNEVSISQVFWFYRGPEGDTHYLHTGVTTVGASSNLTIKDPKLSDSGTYFCTVISSRGSEEASATLTVYTLFKPVVTASRPVVVEGSPNPLQLHCDSRGSTGVSYSWELRRPVYPTYPIRLKFTTDTAILHPPTTANVGVFTCFVRNPAGQESGSLDVHVEVLEAPDVSVHPKKTIREGDRREAKLTCELRGQHNLSMTWLSGSKVLEQATGVNRLEHDIHSPRVQDTGEYTCSVSKDNVTKSASVHLAVYALEPPQVTASGHALPLTLTCNASGTTSPDITWYEVTGGRTQEVTSGVRLHQSFLSTLQVSTSDPHQQPQYVCQVTNPVGTERTGFNVSIQKAPYFLNTTWETSTTVHRGQDVTLDCKGGGVPTPVIEWGLVDTSGFPVTPGLHGVNFYKSLDNFTFTIDHAVDKNSGIYFCKLINKVDQTFRKVNITVIP